MLSTVRWNGVRTSSSSFVVLVSMGKDITRLFHVCFVTGVSGVDIIDGFFREGVLELIFQLFWSSHHCSLA